ncbi:hypothetical protein BCR34DRAFT_163747 [Clohesyomyces aquaticus]|uniref:Uncharacterized protein n=1 Tax=Clohesyomyces aquaticus TaxID=1231657 RepID=A0A1Y1ZZQ4_9PLEO|nr:hypothetical protein BCR34DRAFT_163747 [Clohesyomyces aquaticus]
MFPLAMEYRVQSPLLVRSHVAAHCECATTGTHRLMLPLSFRFLSGTQVTDSGSQPIAASLGVHMHKGHNARLGLWGTTVVALQSIPLCSNCCWDKYQYRLVFRVPHILRVGPSSFYDLVMRCSRSSLWRPLFGKLRLAWLVLHIIHPSERPLFLSAAPCCCFHVTLVPRPHDRVLPVSIWHGSISGSQLSSVKFETLHATDGKRIRPCHPATSFECLQSKCWDEG